MSKTVKEVEVISIDEVKEFAKDLLEKCKKVMKENSRLPRLAYLFIAGPASTESHADTGLTMVTVRNPKEAEVGVFLLDLDANYEQLVSMIAETEPKFRKLLPELRRLAHSTDMKDDQVAHHVVRAWTHMTGMREHTIVTAYMRAMIKRLKPYAVVMQPDAYTLEPPAGVDPLEWRKKCHKNLADEPSAKEAISISLETNKYRWLANVIYKRDPPKTGKVISFEEPRIMASDSPDTAELGGHVFGALHDFPMN